MRSEMPSEGNKKGEVMRKSLFVGALAMVVVATALTISFAHQQGKVTQRTRLHVVEHPIHEVVTDTGATGDTPGDLLTFHNPVFNATNTKRIGHDQGDCIRISPAQGTWECRWITWIDGQGAITVEGAFYDAADSVLAITGGTGMFSNVRGTMGLDPSRWI